jgi:Na+-driven multidrug efflux pump
MKDLTQGKEGKLIFSFAMPMLIGNLFQQNILGGIVNAYWQIALCRILLGVL